MSNHKKDAASPDGNFANFMMMLVAAPVVMAWVGLSIFLVAMAFREPSIVEDIESYKSVLLIIGSPALVIIYKVCTIRSNNIYYSIICVCIKRCNNKIQFSWLCTCLTDIKNSYSTYGITL